jgi:ribosomal protein L21
VSVGTGSATIQFIAVAGKTFRYTDAGPEGLARGKKVIVFKKKKRKNYRRRQGHRQSFTAVRVTAIEGIASSSAETTETGADSHGT